MKFRLISRFGDGLAFGLRLQQAGHDLDFYVTEPASPRVYQGLLKRVDRWNKALTPETIVLFDMTGLGQIADSLRQTGHQVYGAGGLNDRLELDRHFAQQLAKSNGLNVPETETYDDIGEAVAEIRRRPSCGWVYRPVTSSPAPFTYVAASSTDMRLMLEHFGRASAESESFTLSPVTAGTMVSIGCWYVRGQPQLSTLYSSIELSHFLTGGLGPRTGGMGAVTWFWRNPTTKLYRLTHEKLLPFLARYGYDGPLTIRVIIAEADLRPVFLDASTRFDFPTSHALAEDLGVDLAETLAALAVGKSVQLRPSYEWCGALRVTTPPFPYRLFGEAFAGKPVMLGGDHVWPLDLFLDDAARLVTAGGDGVLCDLTARAAGLKELGKALYSEARRLMCPDKQYRVDLIETAETTIRALTASKYLKKPKGEAIHA